MRISEQIETARRERRVLARVCRAAWRLEQAGRERAWALASALAEGVPIRTLAGAWLVRTARFATMNMLSNSGNRLLVFGCERSVSGTHRNSAAEGGGPAVAPAVLQSLLGEGLEGQPASVILTGARGVVLRRLTADHDLERHLDSIQLAPGFSYAGEFAGTNGTGTAPESGQAAHMSGHEHYAGQLVDLACAAVPIRHPVSGLRINEGEAHAQEIDLRSR